MKFLTYLLISVSATTVLAASSSTPNLNAEECGALGVMEVDLASLPEGVTAADVRKCRDHPLGRPAYPGAGVGGVFRRFLPTWVF
ncbi:uncharacterized protein BO80DRAFT_423469 [Aspergillus ibericus CBS 121593]|uniref:Uncharacterized protein n=1 Tax=Aspergillus ibericus CBS 121593 TaxID=1448316 RepID=A0A395H809_9EURO|nr:hypothetical protein BO80DRAFT_423469 [Aspergillus ibericus CBS 121593]RAL03018.1 hypothetical protein BO80DRAFT_423469 [Aspergillus ibericus CBS 121593]